MQSEVFHVSRSSDGQREWYSARDAATGVSIPCECKDRAIALATSLNSAFKHHLTAALSDKQAVEVKALEWCGDGDCYAFADVTHQSYSIAFEEGKYWANWDMSLPPFDTLQATQAAAQADYEQRIRSALVDVPAVEPVGEATTMVTNSGVVAGFTVAAFPADKVPAGTKLYTSPPLSREGEDSAEVFRSALQRISELAPSRANAKDARDLHLTVKAIADAVLAATRSGSATDQKGNTDE